ncbi:MAG TPA: DUF4215 domain-containing protein [Candidatus Limnocylindria bacterium]|nr:DUF4215 domain-containing protein [Candidatus Limnocylindria bacterium]
MRARCGWFLLALLTCSPAWATTADDLCAPTADPCVVPQGNTVAVTNGSVIDLGGRALVLAAGSGTRLDAGSGSMTIVAGSVTLNPGSALLARGGSIMVVTTSGNVAVLRAGTARARIDVGDFTFPGVITVDSAADIEVQGIVTAQGSGADAGSGSIGLMAEGDVLISGEVDARAGANGIGGDIELVALGGDVRVSGVVDVTAGIAGGTISIGAGGSMTTLGLSGARLDAKAVGVEGDGGAVDISATTGDVEVNIPISVQGTSGTDAGGSGGDITIDALGGNIRLNAPIDLSGAIPDGDGGDFDAAAGIDLVQTAKITSLGRDQLGVGGSIDLFGERSVTVGPIDVRGTCLTCAGGDVNAIGWCAVTVPAGVVIDASGSGGGVGLRSEDLAVHGTVRAGLFILLQHRDAANPPDLAGAVLQPTPDILVEPDLVPCGGLPATSCGNGITETGETCDDGNTESCDGCSPTCQTERCGDGRLGCDEHGVAEACDDGNTTACDGCAADCSRRDDVCGDGIVECGEECDTGAPIDCDAGACSAQCREEGCGNGRVECSEQCDDGGPSETCDDMCLLMALPTCGNGVEDPGEGCDDGNSEDCDGCSHFCQVEGCGNGVTECAEECDDFNTTACDGCSAVCEVEACGNEIVDCGEECDLGALNGAPGSNCLECRFAPVCSTDSPEACIPCGDVFDCDPLGRCAGTDCVDGVCTPDPLECTADDPCEIGSCEPASGCQFAPVLGFDSVRCRLAGLGAMLASDSVTPKGRATLVKLLDKAGRKIDAAEAALDAGRPKKVGKALRTARRAVVRFGKKVVRLQPKQITDLELGAALSEGSGDALSRIETLRGDLGV